MKTEWPGVLFDCVWVVACSTLLALNHIDKVTWVALCGPVAGVALAKAKSRLSGGSAVFALLLGAWALVHGRDAS